MGSTVIVWVEQMYMSVAKNVLPGGSPMKPNNRLSQTLPQMVKCANGAQQESGVRKKAQLTKQCVKIVLPASTRKHQPQIMQPTVILVYPGVTWVLREETTKIFVLHVLKVDTTIRVAKRIVSSVNLVNSNLNKVLKHVMIAILGNSEGHKIVLLFVNCVWQESLRVTAVRRHALNVCRVNFNLNKELKRVMSAVLGNFVGPKIVLVNSVKNAKQVHTRVKGGRGHASTASPVNFKYNEDEEIVPYVLLEKHRRLKQEKQNVKCARQVVINEKQLRQRV